MKKKIEMYIRVNTDKTFHLEKVSGYEVEEGLGITRVSSLYTKYRIYFCLYDLASGLFVKGFKSLKGFEEYRLREGYQELLERVRACRNTRVYELRVNEFNRELERIKNNGR